MDLKFKLPFLSVYLERQRERENQLARQLYRDGAPTFDEAAGLPPLTPAEIEQQDRDVAAESADYDRLIAEGFDLTTGAPKEDPGPSATDRGPGVEFTMRSTGEVIEDHGSGVEYHTIDLSGPATIQLDLPPEVMAQLQRIEDRLLGVEVFLAKIWATVAPAPKNEVIRPPMILGDDDYDDDEL